MYFIILKKIDLTMKIIKISRIIMDLDMRKKKREKIINFKVELFKQHNYNENIIKIIMEKKSLII